jgi:hypothetical protein
MKYSMSCQGSNAACSLALKPDGVVVSRRHSPSYDSSSRLALRLDGGAIYRHLSLDTTLGCTTPLNLARIQHWIRQTNRPQAAELIKSLGGNGAAQQSAAKLVAVMQTNGQAIDFVGLQKAASLLSVPGQLTQMNRNVGSNVQAAGQKKSIAALRERANIYEMQTKASAPPASASDAPSAEPTSVRIERFPTSKRNATTLNLPPKPAPGQPVTQAAAFVERDGKGLVLNLAGQDLRRTPDLASQIRSMQSTMPQLRISMSNADLRGVNLSDLKLVGANFSGANLSRANLSGSDVHAGLFVKANLSGANLSGAGLTANLGPTSAKPAWTTPTCTTRACTAPT